MSNKKWGDLIFISNLDVEKQKSFLNLAYTLIYADGKFDSAEKKLFYSYKAEVDVDLSEAHKVDFKEELVAFDDCKVEEKIGIFFELYALALLDNAYPEEEKILIAIVKDHFGITDDKMNQMHEGIKKLIKLQNEFLKIVKSD